MVQPEPDRDDYDERSDANIAVLIAVAVIVAIGCFVVWEMKKTATLEDCIAASHKNCEPIDTQDSH